MPFILLSILLFQAAAPPPAGVKPSVLTQPDWVRKPNGEDLARVYPQAAIRKNESGRATIECKVAETGALTDCRAIEDTPPGDGFGDAALKLAERFTMRPLTKDGVPVGGGTVRIPIRFVVPANSLPAVRVVQPGAREGRVEINCRVGDSGGFDNCFPQDADSHSPDLYDAAQKAAAKIAVPKGLLTGARIILPIHVVPPAETPTK